MTYLPVKLVGVSLIILGLEWGFHFWRKFRDDPLATMVEEVDAVGWMLDEERPNHSRLALGSVAGGAAVVYLGANVLYAGWPVTSWGQLFVAWRALEASQWVAFHAWLIPLMIGWLLLAAWLSDEWHHPVLPQVVVEFLGTIAQAVAAVAAILVITISVRDSSHHLVGTLFGAFMIGTVLISAWTGGLFQYTRGGVDADDPAITRATDYPFSYCCLSAFLLLFGWVALTGTPSS